MSLAQSWRLTLTDFSCGKARHPDKDEDKPHRRIKDWKAQCDTPPSLPLPLPLLGQFSNRHFDVTGATDTSPVPAPWFVTTAPAGSWANVHPALSQFHEVSRLFGAHLVAMENCSKLLAGRLGFASGWSGALAPQDTAEPSQLTHSVWVTFFFVFFIIFVYFLAHVRNGTTRAGAEKKWTIRRPPCYKSNLGNCG